MISTPTGICPNIPETEIYDNLLNLRDQGDFILPRKLKRIHLLQEKLDNRLPIGYKES